MRKSSYCVQWGCQIRVKCMPDRPGLVIFPYQGVTLCLAVWALAPYSRNYTFLILCLILRNSVEKKYLQCSAMELRICLVFLCYRTQDRAKDTDILQVLKRFYPWDYLKLEVCTTPPPPKATKNRKSRITDETGTMNGAVSQRIIRTSDSDYCNIATE